MLERLEQVPSDPLIELIGEYKRDLRDNKIDLGVGVYRDHLGNTPVMQAVKQAEQEILSSQISKSYLGLAGDPEFVEALRELTFKNTDTARFTGLQTPGSSAALRVAGDLIKLSNADAKIWIGLPCWANHIPLFSRAGLKIETYNYYDASKNQVDRASTFSALNSADAGDFILLQGCCHNPTGTDFSSNDWHQLADLCLEKGLTPIIDIAYHGFGDGLDVDLANVHQFLASIPEAILTVSCSKSFGLYRERTGAIYIQGKNTKATNRARSNLLSIARTSYSMPPDHGAAIVRTILNQSNLRMMWQNELENMRLGIIATRKALVNSWGNDDALDISYLNNDKGMFSLLPLNSTQISKLKLDHAIYMAGNGRINIAGLQGRDVERFASTLLTVLSNDTEKLKCG